MFFYFKNVNTIHYKKSLYSVVVNKKKMYTTMSSVHGSSVLTINQDWLNLVSGYVVRMAEKM